ncbi:MAG: hypothetical protein KZQ83_16065 [gamma proteobacterium symbiont of Taylorina sp.]|nr:hypothetical protein [gamma proteobacterium symbiont of Taylorina sp.]
MIHLKTVFTFILCLLSAVSIAADVYENDNTRETAKLLQVNSDVIVVQDFGSAGDEDWSKVYLVNSGLARYVFEVKNQQANADAVIELYDRKGKLLFKIDDGIEGEGEYEYLEVQVSETGFYYIKISSHDSQVFGGNTAYELYVYTPYYLSIEDIAGDVIHVTTGQASLLNENSKPSSINATILTADKSSMTFSENNTPIQVALNQNSTINLLTDENTAKQTKKRASLIEGSLTISIDADFADEYELTNPIVTIKTTPTANNKNRQRASTGTQFSTSYTQQGNSGKTQVSVVSGTVDVIQAGGSKQIVNAGQEVTISSIVPKSTWVLPVDGGVLLGGRDNLFAWTVYPNASNYLLEINFPVPVFAEENVSSPEDINKTLVISTDIIYQDLVIFNLPLPTGLDGIKMELRIFALDAEKKVIGESVSSDRATLEWVD